jgi:hypothetical protein
MTACCCRFAPPGKQQEEERERRRQRVHGGSVPEVLPRFKGEVDWVEFLYAGRREADVVIASLRGVDRGPLTSHRRTEVRTFWAKDPF